MKAVQELVAYFDRRGKLSASRIRKLLDGGFLAADAPANMLDLCDDIGTTWYFRICGECRWPGLGHRHLRRQLRARRRRRACRAGQARRDRLHQGDGGAAALAISRLGAQRRHQQQFRPLREGLPALGDRALKVRGSHLHSSPFARPPPRPSPFQGEGVGRASRRRCAHLRCGGSASLRWTDDCATRSE